MAIDPHSNQQADQEEREGPHHSEKTHLGGARQEGFQGEELQREARELISKLGHALTNPELQEVRVAPEGWNGHVSRRQWSARISSCARARRTPAHSPSPGKGLRRWRVYIM